MNDFQKDIDAVGDIEAVQAILQIICRITGMGFAAVARVTEDRWIACQVVDNIAFGLKPGGELRVETTICNEIRESRNPVIIDHVAEDEAYCGHHTPATYGFQSYISMPIILPNGNFFGTLCAIDPKPAKLNTPEVIGIFKLFSDLIGFHLNARDRLTLSEANLSAELRNAELREQFIAVLGHDLRNPLASIQAGTHMLARTPLDNKATTIVTLMKKSVSRMSELIDNVLDLARGRLGGGFPLKVEGGVLLESVLGLVVDELRAANPTATINTHFELGSPVHCDPLRIAQLFSNLLGNALTHGTPEAPVLVEARTTATHFELDVSNAGEPISPAAMESLFEPFYRGQIKSGLEGLGLGLYIASEIAKAHDGTLTVVSSVEETRFTFRMPLDQA